MGSVFNRGTKSKPRWYAQYKEHGRWRMVNTKAPTKAQAQKFLAAAEFRVAQGKVGVEPERKAMTFHELATYWLKNHSAVALTSHDDNVGRMKHLEAAFGKRPLVEITTVKVDEFKAKMATQRKLDADGKVVKGPDGKPLRRYAPNTINRVLALLRKVMNDGAKWGHVAVPPKVKLLPVHETAFDYLTREETERFLSWTKTGAPADFPLYATAIYTGMRMGELYGLHWGDLDLGRGLVTVSRSYAQPFTKSKKVRRVRINSQLSVLLKLWKDRCPPGSLAFPNPDGSMRRREVPPIGFKGHLEAARCHEIRFHDLRHTAASLMVMSGASLRTVQQMLGHSTITVTEKYAHLAPDFMEREADRLQLDVADGLGHLTAIDGGR